MDQRRHTSHHIQRCLHRRIVVIVGSVVVVPSGTVDGVLAAAAACEFGGMDGVSGLVSGKGSKGSERSTGEVMKAVIVNSG